MNMISDFLERVHENFDSEYLRGKREAQKHLQSLGLMSSAVLISSLALGILGIALSALGSVIGIPLILISLPAGYLSFNSYKVSINMRDIIDNPSEYQTFVGLLDKPKIKRKLEQETFCASWFVDYAVEKIS